MSLQHCLATAARIESSGLNFAHSLVSSTQHSPKGTSRTKVACFSQKKKKVACQDRQVAKSASFAL